MGMGTGAGPRQAALGVLVGLVAVLGAVWTGRTLGGATWRPGPVRVWVADRGGGRVVGLDQDLFEAISVSVVHPVDVEGRGDGGAWVLAAGGGPFGPHTLLRVAPGGGVVDRLTLGRVADLEALDGQDAVAVELGGASGGANRVLRIAPGSAARTLARIPGAVAATGRGDRVLVGCADGSVGLYDVSAETVRIAWRDLGGGIADVAVGPGAGRWWVLELGGAGTIHLLGEQLDTLWQQSSGPRGLHMAPVAGQERVWVAGSAEPVVRRFGPGGVVEVESDFPLPRGLGRGAAWKGAGFLVLSPGAVLELDRWGSLTRTQGGFGFLVDVEAASAP